MDIMMRLKGAGFSVIANEFRQRERRLGTGLPLQDFIEIVLQGLPKAKTPEEKYANVNALVDLFEDMDINGDGTMEFDEFTSFCVDAGMVATRTKTASLKHRYVRNAKHVIKTMSGAVGVDKVRWCPLFKRFFVLENAAKSVKIFSADGYMVGEVVSQSALLNAPPPGSEVAPEERNRPNDRDGSPRKGDSGHDKESTSPASGISSSQSAVSTTAATAGASNSGIFILDAAFLYKFQCLAVSTTDFVISFYNMEEPKHQQRLRASTLMASGKSGPNYELIPKLTITTTTAQLLLRFCEQSGVLVSAGNDFIVNVWKIIDLENKVLWKRLVHHQDMIMDVLEIPLHDMIASCDLNRTIQLWDIHDCRSRGALIGHVRGIRQMVFSKDHDMLLTAGFEFEAYGWDIASRQVVMKLVGHRAPLIGVQLSLFQTERAITGDSSGVFKVWDISRATGGGLHSSSAGGGQGSRQGGRSASHAVLLESLDPTHQLSRFEPTAFMCLHPHSRDMWATASGSSTLHLFRSTRVQQFDEIPLKAFYHYSANRFIVVSGAVCSVWDGETGACLDEFADVGAGVGSNTTGSRPPTEQASSSHNGSASSSHGVSSTDILLCVQDANCKKLVVLAEDGGMGVFNSQNFVQMRRCEEKFRSTPLTFAYRNQSYGLPPPSCGIVGLHYCSENKLVIATDSHTSSILVIDDGNNESAKGIKETGVLRRLVHIPGGIAASAYSYHASMIATLDEETSNKVSLWDFETLSYIAVCQLEDDEREPDTSLNMLTFWNEFPVLLASDLRGSVYFFATMPTVYAKTGKLLHAFINDHTITATASTTDTSIAESGGDGEEAREAANGTTFITEQAESAARKFLLKRKSLQKATAKCGVSAVSDSTLKRSAVHGGVVTSMHIVFDDDGEQHRYLLFTGDEKGVVRVWDLSQMMRRLSLFKIPESSCKYLRRGYHPRAMFAHDCVKEATMKHANGSDSSTTGLFQSMSSGEILRDPRVLPSQSQLKKLTKQRADAKKKSSVTVTTQLGKLLPPNRVQAGQAPPAATTVAAAEAFLVAKPASKRASSIMNRKESSATGSQIQLPVGDGSLVHARARAAGNRRRSYCLEYQDVSIVSVWSAHTDGITSLEVSKHPNVVVTCGLDMRVFVWNWQGMCLGKLFDAENIGPCRWRFQKDDTKRQEERRVLISELMQELEMQPHQKASRRRETLYQHHMKHKSHKDLPHVNVILLDHIVSKHPEIAAMEKDGLSSTSTDERINAEMEKLHQRNYRAKMSMLQTLEQASAAPGASINSKEIVRIHSLAQVGPLLCVDKFETKDELQQMKFAEKEELTMDRQYLQNELAIGADSSPLAQRASLKSGSLATIKSQIRTSQQHAEEMMENKVALQRHAMAMYSNLRMVQRRSSASAVRKASVDLHENMLLTKQTGIAVSVDRKGDVSKYQQEISELLEPSPFLRRHFSEQTLSLRPQTAPSPKPKRSVARVSSSEDVLRASSSAGRNGDKNRRLLHPLTSSASEANLLSDSSSTSLSVHSRSTSLVDPTPINRRSSLDQLYLDELRRQQQRSPKKSRRPSEAASMETENSSVEASPTFNKLDSINSIIDKAQAIVDSTPGASADDNAQPTSSQDEGSVPQVPDRAKRGKAVGLPTLREADDGIPEEREMEPVRVNESVLRGHLEITRQRMEDAMRDNERFSEGGQSHRSLINKQRQDVEQLKKGKRMEDYIQQKRREMNNNIGAVFKRTSFAFPSGGGPDTDSDEKKILRLPGKKGAKAGSASTQTSENHRAAQAAQAEVEKSKVFGIYGVKEVMSVIRLFWSMDEDGSGALSLTELLAYKNYFEKLGYHDMTTVFQAIDKDGSGNVTLKELLEICFQYATKYQVEEMLKLAKLGDVASYFDASRSKRGGPFMKADHNKGEQSDVSSAKETLSAEERAELMAIFRVFDRNGDGGVSMEEIVEALHVEDDDAMARVAAAEEAQLASRDAAAGGKRRASVSINAPPPVQTSKSGFTKDEVRKIYQDFDKDGSESLEFDEFVALMQTLYGPRH